MNGVFPVAILTTETFDATTVDPATVTLEGAPVAVKTGSNERMAHIEDVNDDGSADLVVQIEDIDGTYEENAAAATLTGETYDGIQVRATDTICIAP